MYWRSKFPGTNLLYCSCQNFCFRSKSLRRGAQSALLLRWDSVKFNNSPEWFPHTFVFPSKNSALERVMRINSRENLFPIFIHWPYHDKKRVEKRIAPFLSQNRLSFPTRKYVHARGIWNHSPQTSVRAKTMAIRVTNSTWAALAAQDRVKAGAPFGPGFNQYSQRI